MESFDIDIGLNAARINVPDPITSSTTQYNTVSKSVIKPKDFLIGIKGEIDGGNEITKGVCVNKVLIKKIEQSFSAKYPYHKFRREITNNDPKITTVAEFDNQDRLIRRQDPTGAITKYDYDLLNRIIKISLPNWQDIYIEYDDIGRREAVRWINTRIGITDGNRSVAYEYFPGSSLLKKIKYYDSNNGIARTRSFSRDEIGRSKIEEWTDGQGRKEVFKFYYDGATNANPNLNPQKVF